MGRGAITALQKSPTLMGWGYFRSAESEGQITGASRDHHQTVVELQP